MKKAMLLGSLCVLFWAADGRAADTKEYDAIFKEVVGSMSQLADVLASIKDKDSADKAKPEIKKIAVKMKELKAKGDKLGKPSKDQEKELMEKYRKDLEAATKKMTTEAFRLASTDYGKDALKDLQELNKP